MLVRTWNLTSLVRTSCSLQLCENVEYQKFHHRGTLSYIISLWNRTQRVNSKHLYQICSRVTPIYGTALIHYFHQWPSTAPEALQHYLILLMIRRYYSLRLHRSKSAIDQWSRFNIKLVKHKPIMSLNSTKSKSIKIYSKRKTNILRYKSKETAYLSTWRTI